VGLSQVAGPPRIGDRRRRHRRPASGASGTGPSADTSLCPSPLTRRNPVML